MDTRALDFMQEVGLAFVRVPLDYRFWIHDFKYYEPDEKGLQVLDSYLENCWDRDLHVNLNIHRAPGYCVMNSNWEKHNLWTDECAVDAFDFQWRMLAERYKHISADLLSFNILNEPPDIGTHSCTRAYYEKVVRRIYASLKEISPERTIFVDGLDRGNTALPELADLDIVMTGRGYQPMSLTHYKAAWVEEVKGLPCPEYPGTLWQGKIWNKDTLREFYQPWRELQKAGKDIHIGEFGCYTGCPDDAALRWYEDLLSLYHEWGWSYALWEFDGTFGVAYHGRPGAKYENYKGLLIDKRLVKLLLDNRTC